MQKFFYEDGGVSWVPDKAPRQRLNPKRNNVARTKVRGLVKIPEFVDRVLQAFEKHTYLEDGTDNQHEWFTDCPICREADVQITFDPNTDKIFLRCTDDVAPCDTKKVLRAVGLDFRDLDKHKAAIKHTQDDARTEDKQATLADVRVKIKSLHTLQHKKFAARQHLVKGIIQLGAVLFVAKPKTGKSWGVLLLALAKAMGDMFWGRPLTAGRVLYLALEDPERRLKNRARKLLAGRPWPKKRFKYVTMDDPWPRADQGGVSALDEVCGRYKPEVVIIDTLDKFRRKAGNRDKDDARIEAVEALQEMANRHGITIIIVYHLRKAAGDDPLDEVRGAGELTAIADSTLILKRRRGQGGSTLFVTGRDVDDETTYALNFDKASVRWEFLGKAGPQGLSNEQVRILRVLRKADKPISPKLIAKKLGKPPNNIQQQLRRMLNKEGLIEITEHGRYQAVPLQGEEHA